MSSSAFLEILLAAEAALRADPPVATSIYRNRSRTLPQVESADTAVVVRLGQSRPEEGAIRDAPTDWTTVLEVECYAAAHGATDGDVAVDVVLQAVHARLLADPTLGGLVDGISAGAIEWAYAATDEDKVCAIQQFVALHETAEHNLQPRP